MGGENIVEEIKEDLSKILEGDSEKLVTRSKQLGELLGKDKKRGGEGMTTSQIRNIFSEVKKMQNYNKYELDLLRPKLAYTAGRHHEVRYLQEVLDEAIKEVDGDEKFERFKDFFEAIVAYHRKWGKD